MENGICSKECIFGGFENCDATCLDCAGYTREDGKNVIFKLVDWSAKEER
jgi:ATP-dependent protease Clp ATPase subunit